MQKCITYLNLGILKWLQGLSSRNDRLTDVSILLMPFIIALYN